MEFYCVLQRSLCRLTGSFADASLWQATADPQNRLPPELMRRYDVVFVPRSTQKRLKLREVGSKHVGTLVTVQVGAVACHTGQKLGAS